MKYKSRSEKSFNNKIVCPCRHGRRKNQNTVDLGDKDNKCIGVGCAICFKDLPVKKLTYEI